MKLITSRKSCENYVTLETATQELERPTCKPKYADIFLRLNYGKNIIAREY